MWSFAYSHKVRSHNLTRYIFFFFPFKVQQFVTRRLEQFLVCLIFMNTYYSAVVICFSRFLFFFFSQLVVLLNMSLFSLELDLALPLGFQIFIILARELVLGFFLSSIWTSWDNFDLFSDPFYQLSMWRRVWSFPYWQSWDLSIPLLIHVKKTILYFLIDMFCFSITDGQRYKPWSRKVCSFRACKSTLFGN